MNKSKNDQKPERIREIEQEYAELKKHIFRSATVPMIMVNADGIIVKVNRAYEEWSGIPAQELVGSYMPDKVDNCRTHMVAKTGKPELHQIQRAFGRMILSTRLPIFNSEGKLVGAWAMVDSNDRQSIIDLHKRIERQENSLNNYKNELQTYTSGRYSLDDILGESPSILTAKADVATAAAAQIDVMIRGETGVGKELFAHAVHNSGLRADGPFISMNCSALSPNLAESELFGYEGGSFTDADKRGRPGKFEYANGGTLFLDEIGDMPLSLQPKLLRAIESREVTRVGGQKAIPLDIQIVTATNCDLEQMVEQGLFRRDLYYRLSAYMVHVSPLRERKQDIPILAQFFLETACAKFNRAVKPISETCMAQMMEHSWPGNVRELNNFVRNMIIRSDPAAPYYQAVLGREVKRVSAAPAPEEGTTLSSHEEQALRQALQRTGGNISRVASLLQVDRNTVYRKMKKYNLNRELFR